jgi:hypothetical protein
MFKHIKVMTEDHKEFKKIASERGMLMRGLFSYVIRMLKEGKI